MPARSTKSLNLLPRSEFEVSFWGRFLKWALTAGRYIIILTELVVIVAFLSRFKLDQEASNLSEAIEGKKNVLGALKETEKDFRLLQARLAAGNSLVEKQIPVEEILREVNAEVPSGVSLNSVIVTTDQVAIVATTATESAVGEFLAKTNDNSRWKKV